MPPQPVLRALLCTPTTSGHPHSAMDAYNTKPKPKGRTYLTILLGMVGLQVVLWFLFSPAAVAPRVVTKVRHLCRRGERATDDVWAGARRSWC